MPLSPVEQFRNSNVEKAAALACGPRGCVRTAPVYRYGGVHRYGYGGGEAMLTAATNFLGSWVDFY
jgi:hypothetical protein